MATPSIKRVTVPGTAAVQQADGDWDEAEWDDADEVRAEEHQAMPKFRTTLARKLTGPMPESRRSLF